MSKSRKAGYIHGTAGGTGIGAGTVTMGFAVGRGQGQLQIQQYKDTWDFTARSRGWSVGGTLGEEASG